MPGPLQDLAGWSRPGGGGLGQLRGDGVAAGRGGVVDLASRVQERKLRRRGKGVGVGGGGACGGS